jgi:hypothetical protein
MRVESKRRPRATISAGVALVLIAATGSGCGTSRGADSTSSSGTATSPAPIHGTYSPSITPANFGGPVDNRYFPLKPDTRLHYVGVAEDGKTRQVDDVVVTRKTKQILGVACTAVRDTVSSRKGPVERTYDFYAEDKQGNVWYFGEDSRSYRNGRFVKAGDSWEAGIDGAKPGIIMEAHPKRGDTYRQEYYPGHAEDQARVLGSGGPVKVRYRSFRHTLAAIERSHLEPRIRETKYYAAGVGEIKSQEMNGSREAFQLVTMKH